MNTIYLYIVFGLILGFMVLYFYIDNKMVKLVTKLKSDGWTVFINANNCGFCTEQIKFFGRYFSHIPTVHCDDKNNLDKCKDIKAFPTWEKNGKLYGGGRFSLNAFEKLFEKSRGSETNDSI